MSPRTLLGGYGQPCDPASLVSMVRAAPLDAEAWDHLWQELHHQGDVGVASYAAIPLLVDACASVARDWNFYGLIATIESSRHVKGNPVLPSWLEASHAEALQRAADLALTDLASRNQAKLGVQAALSVVALASGALELGRMLAMMDSSEIAEWVEAHSA
jgi:hypothetical protein